jgi:hypothetical protein
VLLERREDPKILYWNVRGLNERYKCIRLRNLHRDWKAGIVCLKKVGWKLCLEMLGGFIHVKVKAREPL